MDGRLPLSTLCDRVPPYPQRRLESEENKNTCQRQRGDGEHFLQHSSFSGTRRCLKKCLWIRRLIFEHLQVPQKGKCREALRTSAIEGKDRLLVRPAKYNTPIYCLPIVFSTQYLLEPPLPHCLCITTSVSDESTTTALFPGGAIQKYIPI